MPTIGEMLAGAVPKPRQSPLAGVLPAVFSAGDKLKRMASDFAADPVGNIQQRIGFLNDQAGQFNQLHSQATQESVNSIKGGGSGFGPASQQLAGKLADAYNPAGVIDVKALQAQFPDLVIDLMARDGRATLSRVVVPKEMRGQGVGSDFMDELVRAADADGSVLQLTPSSDFGGNKNRLKEFYKRFGFVENKGRSKDYELFESMYRRPSE